MLKMAGKYANKGNIPFTKVNTLSIGVRASAAYRIWVI